MGDGDDDDNGEGVDGDSISTAQGGAFEWEFGFALFENFVPPTPPMDVGFLKTKKLKALGAIIMIIHRTQVMNMVGW